jgi:hypothetical protein
VTLTVVDTCTDKTLAVDVVNCARCGDDHLHREFRAFQRSVEITGAEPYTHWAMCPEMIPKFSKASQRTVYVRKRSYTSLFTCFR